VGEQVVEDGGLRAREGETLPVAKEVSVRGLELERAEAIGDAAAHG
jgi:hypothetical protein